MSENIEKIDFQKIFSTNLKKALKPKKFTGGKRIAPTNFYNPENMKKHKDFSLHFTIKNQSLEDLKKKYYDFDAETLESNSVLVADDLGDTETLILHHCFLPEAVVIEKGFPIDVIEFLNTVCDEQICWYQTAETLERRRYEMLRNLKRLDGVAIFLGEIKEGVKEEYDLARALNIPCVLIG